MPLLHEGEAFGTVLRDHDLGRRQHRCRQLGEEPVVVDEKNDLAGGHPGFAPLPRALGPGAAGSFADIAVIVDCPRLARRIAPSCAAIMSDMIRPMLLVSHSL